MAEDRKILEMNVAHYEAVLRLDLDGDRREAIDRLLLETRSHLDKGDGDDMAPTMTSTIQELRLTSKRCRLASTNVSDQKFKHTLASCALDIAQIAEILELREKR